MKEDKVHHLKKWAASVKGRKLRGPRKFCGCPDGWYRERDDAGDTPPSLAALRVPGTVELGVSGGGLGSRGDGDLPGMEDAKKVTGTRTGSSSGGLSPFVSGGSLSCAWDEAMVGAWFRLCYRCEPSCPGRIMVCKAQGVQVVRAETVAQ